MNLVRWGVIGLVIALGAGLVGAQPQGGTIELRGEVVSLVNRTPVVDVDLRIIGGGQLHITQSGTFIVELPREIREVQLRLVGDSTRAILYPVDGRLPVPNDESTIVTVVVGRSTRALLVEELSRRFAQIEQVVEGQGQQYRASLSDVDSLLRRALDAQDNEFQASVSFHKEKLTIVPPLLEAADHYVLEAEDINDALQLLASHAAQDLAALLSLQTAMTEYNQAFTALNRLQNAAVSGIQSLWAGPQGTHRATIVEKFFHEALRLHERHVLSLNDDFVTLQLAHSQDRPTEETIDEALRRISQTAQALDTALVRLVDAKEEMMNELNER